MTTTRYTVRPHKHGFAVFDLHRSAYCFGTWTTRCAGAQRVADAWNDAYRQWRAA